MRHFRRLLSRVVAVGAAAIVVVSLVATRLDAQDFEKNILTGGFTGTYIQFGRDMSTMAQKCGVTLNVRESAGSLENFLGVRKRPFTQFGIVQSDVLEYLNTYAADDPAVARAIVGVRIAFPLYNEEVHILATRDVTSLADLAGKRVAIGVEESGTFLTASLVLDLAEVTPAERLTIDAESSLAALLADDIDAFFYVAGAPTKIFQSDQIDPERFHLVPVADPTLRAVYQSTTIPAGTYSFLTNDLEAIAVKAVLMTYEYNPRRNPYHRASCEAVSEIAHAVVTYFDTLRESGHPKWKQVDLNDIPPGWDVGSCVNAGLDPEYPLSCEGKAPVAAPSSQESNANRAYRERICEAVGC
ncbi:TAXI family TRAP transporter solute-binding subunit [Roseovarius sp. D22-M7]|uniref:TAXI family TRAP transporter solute-binding subunit n=1 Tax=Roseovarius sp. D22-M7 TaxID=3127116 RepID=UPI00300F98FD